MHNIDEQLVLMEKYRITSDELLFLTVLLLLQDVENLIKLLNGEEWEPYKKKLKNFTYRF